MTAMPINPREVESLVSRQLSNQVKCNRFGDAFTIDTPYVLQDGHVFQAVLEATSGGFLLSDGGFVRRQFETFSRSGVMLRERSSDAQIIARELSLDWDDEFSLTADSVESALERLSVLVRATDRSLALLNQRPPRREGDARSRLKSALKDLGLQVVARARPEVPGGLRPVLIDQLVRKDDRVAAVEVLSAKTESGAAISIDRSVTNFRVLEKFEFNGALVAVYDSSSPASSKEMVERFEAAAPKDAVLVPEKGAADMIFQRLAS